MMEEDSEMEILNHRIEFDASYQYLIRLPSEGNIPRWLDEIYIKRALLDRYHLDHPKRRGLDIGHSSDDDTCCAACDDNECIVISDVTDEDANIPLAEHQILTNDDDDFNMVELPKLTQPPKSKTAKKRQTSLIEPQPSTSGIQRSTRNKRSNISDATNMSDDDFDMTTLKPVKRKNRNSSVSPVTPKRRNYELKCVNLPAQQPKSKRKQSRRTLVVEEVSSVRNMTSHDEATSSPPKSIATPSNKKQKRPTKQKTSTPKTSTPKPPSIKTTIPNTIVTPPQKKARQMKDDTFQHYTLVCGLRNMIREEYREKLLRKEGYKILINEIGAIDKLVPLISKSIVLGSRHAHIRLMKLVLSRNEDDIRAEFTPPPVLKNNGQWQRFGYVVEKDFNPTKHTNRENRRTHITPIDPDFRHYLEVNNVDIPYLPFGVRCHTSATNQFCASFHNNIRFRAYSRIWNFFKLHSNDKNAKCSTMKYLFYVAPKQHTIDPKPIPIPNEHLLKLYHEHLRPLLPQGVNRIPLGWLSTYMKDNYDWYRHVYEFINLQLWIYERNRLNDDQNQIRSFTTIPQSKFKRHFISIDTRALGTIVNSFERGAERVKQPDYTSSNIETRHAIWNKYFKLELINTKMRSFDYTMLTDGVTAHFCMRNKCKTKARKQRLDNDGNEISPEIIGYIDERIKREPDNDVRTRYENGNYDTIIGYDPGYRLPVAIVRKDIKSGHESNFTMKWTDFRALCGDPERKMRRHRIAGRHERKMRKLRENREIFPETPSNKSPDYWSYIDYQIQTFNQCCKVYIRRSMARMEFDRYICTQRAIKQIADKITQFNRCILAVGDFKFSPNSPIRGSVRCPMRGLFNLLAQQPNNTVIEIDEYLTTKICSICGSRMQKKGRSKDRFFVCKNRKPVDVILPRAPIWTSKLHKNQIRNQFNQLPIEIRYHHGRIRTELPMQHDYLCTDNPRIASINDINVAKHKTIIWNRDLNAPRNMIYKLECMLKGVEISPVFNRPPRPAVAVQQQPNIADDDDDDDSTTSENE